MRILYVNDYAPPGAGAETIVARLGEGLRARGHETRLLATGARLVGTETGADYPCFGTTAWWQPALEAVNPSAARSMKRALAKFQPDIVHLNMFLWQISPSVLRHLEAIPTVYYAMTYKAICPTGSKLLPDGRACHHAAGVVCVRSRCLSVQAWLPRIVQIHRFRHRVDDIDCIVCASDWVADRFRADGLRSDAVIHPGIALTGSHADRQLGTRPRVGFAGRLAREKGVDVLVDALANVAREIPDFEFVVAGAGPERAAIERRIEHRGLTDRTTMLGHLPATELDAEFRDVWVQVVPSVWEEPFGLVAVEAMRRGTAVVASAIGGLTESVEDGRTGLLVPPGDVDALATAIISILRSRSHAEALGDRGRLAARESFGVDVFLDSFESLYEDLISEIGQ